MLIIKKRLFNSFGKGPTQGLEHTVTAEKLDSINFTKEYKVLFELALPQSK